jgi:hypothetical protein
MSAQLVSSAGGPMGAAPQPAPIPPSTFSAELSDKIHVLLAVEQHVLDERVKPLDKPEAARSAFNTWAHALGSSDRSGAKLLESITLEDRRGGRKRKVDSVFGFGTVEAEVATIAGRFVASELRDLFLPIDASHDFADQYKKKRTLLDLGWKVLRTYEPNP